MKKAIFLFSLILTLSVHAQVEVSGLLDAGATIGGNDSKTITNGIANKYPNFNIQSLSLFLFSSLSDDYSVSAKFSYYPRLYGTGTHLRLVFANISWEPQNVGFGVSIGKILTPFGLYPKKQNSTDNISFLPPMAYGYFVNIAVKNSGNPGYWSLAGENGSYGADEVGTPTVFESGYQTGLKIFLYL